jgi:hypothetical protein
MASHALFHQPRATLRTRHAGSRSAAKSLRLSERRIALMEYLIKRRSERWMTEEAATQRHPTLLEDNPSSG